MWSNCSVHTPWHFSAAKPTLRPSFLETSEPVPVWPCTISFWLITEPRRPSWLQFPLPLFPKGHGNGKFQQLVSMATRHRTSVRGTTVSLDHRNVTVRKWKDRKMSGGRTASSNRQSASFVERHHVTEVSGAGSQVKLVSSESIQWAKGEPCTP